VIVDGATDGHRPDAGPLRRIGRSLWRACLLFVDVIGLRPAPPGDQASQLARFRLYHAEFRKLLSSNDGFLVGMADLERKLLGQMAFDATYLRRRVVRLIADVHRMIESLDAISDERYRSLHDVHQRISQQLASQLDVPGAAAGATVDLQALVLDLPDLRRAHADLVGGKMANLGELHNALQLPTPDGFAVTCNGYRELVARSGLDRAIRQVQGELSSPQSVGRVSQVLMAQVRAASVDPTLRDAIAAAYQRLAGRLGRRPRLAVRSSALGEDGARSFAGQYLSLLNVGEDQLVAAYLDVVASLYSPEAVHYRLLHDIAGDTAAMAVGFVAMVDASASGVAYSKDPNRPHSGNTLIHSVSGLGPSLADGSTSPEEIEVDTTGEQPRIVRTGSQQVSRLVCRSDGGVVEERLDSAAAAQSALSDAAARQLAVWASALEKHFLCPQDIEWVADNDRSLLLVQARPLRLAVEAVRRSEPVAGARVVLDGGEVACAGVGCGPAVLLDPDADLDAFPAGAVLVAKRSSPKFVRVMDRARAIVTDEGSTTGHMASLAREFRVPTLLGTHTASRTIATGSVVTVDAHNARIYAGEVALPIGDPHAGAGQAALLPWVRESPDFKLLQQVAALIVPLRLSDPQSPGFAADNCTTLHDLARFVHEKSYQEMFRLGASLGDFRSSSYHLDVFLPIDLYIIDLGGGLKTPIERATVKVDQIASVPLTALLRGMLNKQIPRYGPRPIDVGGLASIMMRHAVTNPEADRTFRDPCYAMVSEVYLNYTARVGYHFGVVDTYCGKTANKNYINLLFRGGAADFERRCRRAQAIALIAKEWGFSAQRENDSVNARLGKAERGDIVHHLEMIGRLLQFMRQMDAAMASDASMRRIVAAFLRGDYGLVGQAGAG